MADSTLIDAPKSNVFVLLIAFVAPFVLITLGTWIWNLQVQTDQLRHRNDQLYELLQQPSQLECPMVAVVCECPDYDEGWEDAQFAEGCDPDLGSMDIGELQGICDELNSYGYVPSC